MNEPPERVAPPGEVAPVAPRAKTGLIPIKRTRGRSTTTSRIGEPRRSIRAPRGIAARPSDEPVLLRNFLGM